MSEKQSADLVVIGAGPGGYAAAFRAADLGRSVILVDPRLNLGGVCLNEGCIPSKALLHAARVIHEADTMSSWGLAFGKPKVKLDALRSRKDAIVSQLTGGLSQLAKRRKVQCITGSATFTASDRMTIRVDSRDEDWTFKQAIIACGSSPIRLPGWPEDDRIWDSTAALELRQVPRHLTIVGGGIIGLEMATIYSALGSLVTLLDLADQVAPGAEPDGAGLVRSSLEARGCKVHVSTHVVKVEADKDELALICQGNFSGRIVADAVIQAVGRRSNGEKLGLVAAGVVVEPNGIIPVDSQCRTSNPNIFAVGDVTGAPMLAHRATHQGKVAAEVASGRPAALDTSFIPSIAYTDPELAWVGPTTEQLKSAGIPFKVSRFPWAASGRNLASGGGDGQTMLIHSPHTSRILGATIVGPGAGELLAEICLALEMGASLADIALTVHAHPTLSETVAFAAAHALGTLTDL